MNRLLATLRILNILIKSIHSLLDLEYKTETYIGIHFDR